MDSWKHNGIVNTNQWSMRYEMADSIL